MAKARKSAVPRKTARKTAAPAMPAKPGRRVTALAAFLAKQPGATTTPVKASRSVTPVAIMYKVDGRIFAILSQRAEEFVILKCDPNLVPVLKQKYAGIGHRSHLDRRFWIAVSLDSDVPAPEVRRLVGHSYGIVRSPR